MYTAAFMSLAAKNLAKVKEFYSDKLGLKLKDEKMGLNYELPNGGELFIYDKPDHKPANSTALNLVVQDIEKATKDLSGKGVEFDQVDMGDGAKTDEHGIMRGKEAGMGPDIAWFKDPADNVISLMEL